jgi:hypothetical protein
MVDGLAGLKRLVTSLADMPRAQNLPASVQPRNSAQTLIVVSFPTRRKIAPKKHIRRVYLLRFGELVGTHLMADETRSYSFRAVIACPLLLDAF